MVEYLIEAKGYKRKFQCRYCSAKLERDKLIQHIADKHDTIIPEGMTPAQVVFHIVNKKEDSYHGICRVCGGSTPWSEKHMRYKQMCTKKECIDKFKETTMNNLKNKYGDNYTDYLAGSMAHQQKMLSGRKISGKYKFRDGGVIEYMAKYELNFLKMCDDPMIGLDSMDILGAGQTPLIKYQFNGEEHTYFPDFYIIPYNLIVEIKDGGDHVNTRNMPEYRAKTVAKEKAIIDGGEFNYIRLVDNRFQDFLLVLAKLKMQLMEPSDTNERIIDIYESARIQENMLALGLPMEPTNSVFLVHQNKLKKNTFVSNDEWLVSMDGDLRDLYKVSNEGKVVLDKKDNLKNYSIFKSNKDRSIKGMGKILKAYVKGDKVGPNFIVEALTGQFAPLAESILLADFKTSDEIDVIKRSTPVSKGKKKEDDDGKTAVVQESSSTHYSDHIYINYDEFIDGTYNFLLVTGLSGAGKSTLSKRLAKSHNATLINLDTFTFSFKGKGKSETFDKIRKSKDQPLGDYLKTRPDLLYLIEKDDYAEYRKRMFTDEGMLDTIKFTIKWCMERKNKKYVIEGVHIFSGYKGDVSDISSYPIILVNTSGIKAYIQRIGREFDLKKPEDIGRFLRSFPRDMEWYSKDIVDYKKFKRAIL